MMELGCALVFTLVSIVSATPHGYGVKGGATAKAQAGAVSSAYGGLGALPLSIPGGPGFSGSFSKSSSSSFASSSASSSAGSFSFSGSGATGLSGFDLKNFGTNGGSGCSSGDCKNGETSGISGSQNSGLVGNGQAYNGATAAAAATAIAGSMNNPYNGNPETCSGANCSNHKKTCEGATCIGLSDHTKKCNSGKCDLESIDENETSDNGSKKCSSGQCDSLSNASGASDAHSADCNNGKCAMNDSDEKSSITKTRNCGPGQCGTLSQSGSISLSNGFDKCTSGSCKSASDLTSPSNENGSNDIHVGSTSYSSSKSAPNSENQSSLSKDELTNISYKEPGCMNGDCGGPFEDSSPYNDSSTISNEKKPYFVASGATNTPRYNPPVNYLTTPRKEAPCTSPDCTSPNESIHSSLNPANVQPDSLMPICSGNNCNQYNHKSTPNNNNPSEPSRLPSKSPVIQQINPNQPNYSKIPLYQAPKPLTGGPVSSLPNTPTYSQETYSNNCGTGNCFGLSASQIPTYRPSTSEVPHCAPGTCSSQPSIAAGYNIPRPNVPNYPTEVTRSGPTNCALGHCSNYPTFQHANAFPGGPIKCVSGICSNSPSDQNTGRQGDHINPDKCISGNCAIYNPSGVNNFNTEFKPMTHSQRPSHPANCPLGNCADHSLPQQHPQFAPSSSKIPAYNQGLIINNHGLIPNNQGLCTSGNCGSGPLNTPTTYHVAKDRESNGPLPAFIPLGSAGQSEKPKPYEPAYSYTPNSAAIPSYNVAGGSLSTTISDISKPNANKDTTYTGSYGGPTGLPRPSEFYVPSGNSKHNEPTPSCLSGNCGISSDSNGSKDKYSPLVTDNPVSCTNGNCGSGLPFKSTGSSHPNKFLNSASAVNAGAEHPSSTIFAKPTPAKEQIYSGGFGGPPGLLKPYEFDIPQGNIKPITAPSCSAGSCNSSPDVSGVNNYNSLSSSQSPVSCTSGNCGAQSSNIPHYGQSDASSGAVATAVSSSNAAVYTGGFGGPPGILKPFDDGKITNTNNKHLTGFHNSNNDHNHNLSNGNQNSYDSKQKGLSGQAGATATAVSGAFSGGNYEHGCGVGCDLSDSHGERNDKHLNAGFGFSKTGQLEHFNGGANSAAAAKSIGGAASHSGSNSYAFGKSFASSSASAGATSGATKGGYGR